MNESLFDSILRCPICTSPLAFLPSQHPLITSSTESVLLCTVCGHMPPRSNGVFTLDKSENNLSRNQRIQATKNYNNIWTEFDKYDANTSTYHIEKRIISSFKDSFEGKLVLDAGVGDGRHLDLLLDTRPRALICVDAHDVIYRARNRAIKTNTSVPILFIKADLHENVFVDNSFDTTWSIGVLTVVSAPQIVAQNLSRATKECLFVGILSDNLFGKIYLWINPLRPLFRWLARLGALSIFTLPVSLLLYTLFKLLLLASQNNDFSRNLNKLTFPQAISHIQGLLQEPLLVKGLQNIQNNRLSIWLAKYFALHQILGQELFLKYLIFKR